MSGSSERLARLFTEALELASGDRGRFLEQLRAEDPALALRLAELLEVEGEASEFFDSLGEAIAAAAGDEIEQASRPKMRVGAYRVLRAIGHGGMGAVYLAERVDGQFDQQVALKLLHLDMTGPEAESRFLAERQLLARLSHPRIARLLDGGVTAEGRPFFAMEHVEGVPITRYCGERQLALEATLRLFLDMVEAVAYLHRNLVVHRDLKPSNIFVDREGRVKLLDFGIAKLLVAEADGGMTRTGERLLTPDYAAPEQLRGEAVTTASDVYALGAVLYELLSGLRPFDRSRSDSTAVQPRPPAAPSSALRNRREPDGAVAGSPWPPRRHWRALAGDLDTICLKALREEPERRYPSADRLGEDIERYLEGLPVRARRSTLRYRLAKFARRNRRAVAAATVLLALLGVGFARERGLRGVAEQARARAQEEAAKAIAVSEFLSEILSSAEPEKAQGRQVTVAEVVDEAARRLDEDDNLVAHPRIEASLRLTLGNTYRSLGDYPAAEPHLVAASELVADLPPDEPERLRVDEAMGVLLYLDGRFEEAEATLERVVAVRAQALGEAHPDTLQAVSHLANVLWRQRRYEEVADLDRRTLEIRRRVLGEEHADTLRSLNAVATTLFALARYEEAAPLFERALGGQRAQLGEAHPDTLSLLNNLAATYTELGRSRDAEPLFRSVVEGRRIVLGERHERTARAWHNLGACLLQLARYEEAESSLRKAIELREPLNDPTPFLHSRSYLADLYRDQGRWAEAERLYLSTLGRQRELLGAEHQNTLRTVTSLAALHLRQDRVDRAEELVLQALEAQSRTVGEDHPDALGSAIVLARIRNRRGRFAEALALSEKALELGGPALGPDHPVVLEGAVEKVVALRGLKRLPAAEELARRIHDARRRVLGDGHPATAAVRMLVAELSSPAPA